LPGPPPPRRWNLDAKQLKTQNPPTPQPVPPKLCNLKASCGGGRGGA